MKTELKKKRHRNNFHKIKKRTIVKLMECENLQPMQYGSMYSAFTSHHLHDRQFALPSRSTTSAVLISLTNLQQSS